MQVKSVHTVCYRWLNCLTRRVQKCQDQFAEKGMAYLMEIDIKGEETFQVGVHRRAGIGSRNKSCTFYVLEISLRKPNSQLGVCCVYARVGNAR